MNLLLSDLIQDINILNFFKYKSKKNTVRFYYTFLNR